jgi:hypothetical protein
MYRLVDLQHLLITNKLYLKKWKSEWLVDFLEMSFPENNVAKEQKFHSIPANKHGFDYLRPLLQWFHQ